MTGERKHPGATGVAPWIEWNFSAEQRLTFQEWIRNWKLKRVDEEALLDTIEASIRTYVQMKELAKESSPESVRRNLGNAVKASERLLARVNQLDGNSHKIIRNLARGCSIRDSVVETHKTLLKGSRICGRWVSSWRAGPGT